MSPAIIVGSSVLALLAIRAIFKLIGTPWSVVLVLATILALLVTSSGCSPVEVRRADREYQCWTDGSTKVCNITVEVPCNNGNLDCIDLPDPECRCYTRNGDTDCHCYGH